MLGYSRDIRDLDEDFDIDDEEFRREFRAGVAALAHEVGDWRGHLPYEAILSFRSDAATRGQYSSHVSECAYCQELIETLSPNERGDS